MSISLTEAAASRVRAFITQDPNALGLRLGVKRTGCSGWSYQVDLARAVGEGDHVFTDRGVRVVIDAASLPLLDGVEVDFAKKGLNAEFVFHNPNASGECGCGESFTVG